MIHRHPCIFKACLRLAGCLCIAASLCIAGCRREDHVDVDRSAYPIKGIDVSAHNGDIDFALAAADSVAFVMVKATEGADYIDPRFEANCEQARQAGLKVGAYHFFRFGTPGHIQAYHLLSVIGDRRLDLPIAIDVEEWQNDANVPTEEVRAQLRSMADVLLGNGCRVMIYTNKKGYADFVEGDFDDVPLWICSLSEEPRQPWALWQHSHSGHVRGVSGKVDVNTFRADSAAWLRFSQPG